MQLNVLIVDDNLDTLRIYSKILYRKLCSQQAVKSEPATNATPVEILQASTAREALNLLRSEAIDILIVDLKITGLEGEEMGGLELINESQKLEPLRSIIVITGFGTVELARQTLRQGAFDFIEKSETAGDELVESVRKAVERRENNLLRFGNPFSRMTDEEPPVFGGRIKELEFFNERLVKAINSRFREHFVVLGDWGIGKTTLLREYKRLAQSRGTITALVRLESLGPRATLTDAVRSIVEGIIRDLPFSVKRLERLVDFFGSIGINILGTGLQLSRNNRDSKLSPQAFLYDSLLQIWHDLESRTDILVILLDDLDNLYYLPEVVASLKQALSMETIKKARILVGMACPTPYWLRLTSMERHHPLGRYFMHKIQLDRFSVGDMRDIINQSLTGTGISFTHEVTEKVCDLANGHPFEMQVICHHLFNNQLSGRVDMSVWDKSLDAAANDLGQAIFDYRLRLLSAGERSILKAIALGGSETAIADIKAHTNRKRLNISERTISNHIRKLIEKDLVYKTSGKRYKMVDRLLGQYLRLSYSRIT